jgi:hypothetical protein
MLSIQRLNMDNTWLIAWQSQRLLVDPWLTGSEIDGAPWFNEQWHATPPVPIYHLPPFDAIVVTQSYNDHCHLPTLAELEESYPIFATPKPWKKISKAFPDRTCRLIPPFSDPEGATAGDLRLFTITPARKIDPVYYALAITCQEEAIILAPHGFTFSEAQLDFLQRYRIRLLATTFALVALPALLGGHVNPGLKNARQLVRQLRPQYVVNTHDEQKYARGLVMRLARTEYPDPETVVFDEQTQLLRIDHYDPVALD